MGISAFDEEQKAIKWNYIVSVGVVEHDKWIAVEKRFTISDDIKYIRFRLAGVGVGEYRFDDIVFRKEERDVEREKLKGKSMGRPDGIRSAVTSEFHWTGR